MVSPLNRDHGLELLDEVLKASEAIVNNDKTAKFTQSGNTLEGSKTVLESLQEKTKAIVGRSKL